MAGLINLTANGQTVSANDHSGDRPNLLEMEVQNLQRRVGERVRKAREAKGIPRRVVSERSGVSPRYLAQLEAGAGNISIGLLQRVALVLDHQIEWFVGQGDGLTTEALRIAELYRSATAENQRKAWDALSPRAALRGCRICLIGLRGAGKSTLGAMAGKMLGVPFLELNSAIEDETGMPVSEVLALYGQEGYRDLEVQALDRVIAGHETVILAAAGGVVSAPKTFATLLEHFHAIWLKASPEEHMTRVLGQGDTRPMGGSADAMVQLREILRGREALYRHAHAQLDTSGKPLAASAEELVALIRAEGFLEDTALAGS